MDQITASQEEPDEAAVELYDGIIRWINHLRTMDILDTVKVGSRKRPMYEVIFPMFNERDRMRALYPSLKERG